MGASATNTPQGAQAQYRYVHFGGNTMQDHDLDSGGWGSRGYAGGRAGLLLPGHVCERPGPPGGRTALRHKQHVHSLLS